MVRAVFHGLLVAAILAGTLGAVAVASPTLGFHLLLRTFAAFFVAYLIFSVVEDAAGMTGWFTIIWSVLLSAAALISTNFVLFEAGVEMFTRRGTVIPPEEWIEPMAVLFMNAIPMIGVGAAVMLCRDGTPGGSTLADILTLRIWWGAW
jgi:hypothetical protein